jgi:hypothetical protein
MELRLRTRTVGGGKLTVAEAVFLAGALVVEDAAEGLVLLFVTAFLPEGFGGLVSFLTTLAAGLTGLFCSKLIR